MISVRDTAVRHPYKEDLYHGILLGSLNYKDTWYAASNRESGGGYRSRRRDMSPSSRLTGCSTRACLKTSDIHHIPFKSIDDGRAVQGADPLGLHPVI